MKFELAESILKSTLDHWDTSKLSDEIKDIQIISEIKYDDYQQYTHGMRYIESLALWLRQFDSPEEKDCAYDLIKNKLVYISEEEMRQLIMYSHEICMKKIIMEKTKLFCEEQGIININDRKKIFKSFERCSLFLGLSDGAHIDFFRRQNTSLSNEQVFVHYDFSKEKANDMREKLKNETYIIEISKQYSSTIFNDFSTFFLVDDFTGSGKSYIRKDARGWHGKINSFYENLNKYGFDTSKSSIHLVIYIATQKALSNIKKQVKDFALEKGIRNITVDSIQIVQPLDWDENRDLSKLLENNYNKLNSEGRISYDDIHFKVGGGSKPYYGFGDCSLPLVLYHNTPNNSLPILWYSWQDHVNALFLRITRHKETLDQ